MTSFRIAIQGPFSLASARDFLQSFPAAEGTAAGDGDGDVLRLAFRQDGDFRAVGVRLAQDGSVRTDGDPVVVERQVRRMLALDVDATGFAEVGRRDPVVGRLQEERPGFRLVSFPSPYEAGIWGLLTQRISMAQATKLRRLLSEPVEVDGHTLHVPLHPERLLDLEAVPGIPAPKLQRLQGLAEAALAGRLDAERLRALPEEEALAELEGLPGVGPWTARHVLTRGAALSDALPLGEPRVVRAIGDAYGLGSDPDPEALRRLAEGWRPYRMWVCMLLVLRLAREGRWTDPGDAKRRGRAARKL